MLMWSMDTDGQADVEHDKLDKMVMSIKMVRQLAIIDIFEEEYRFRYITHWLAVMSSVDNWLEIRIQDISSN